MTVLPVVSKLETLIEYLDGLTSRAPVAELKTRLAGLNITVEDVADYVHFGQDRYLRNLVHEGDWYHVLAICWRSGQRSPIHNHAGSTCGFKVLRGTGIETVFDLTPCGQVSAVKSTTMPPGYICVAKDTDIHQVSNLQSDGVDLVTLHIYSPPLLVMGTYSLTDPKREEVVDPIFEFVSGAGI